MNLEKIKKMLKQDSFIGDEITDKLKPKDYIFSGSYLLNCLITADPFKGLPSNKIIQLAGDSSTGKTFLSQELVINAQKQGYEVVYIDTEGAQDAEQLVKRGIDLNKFMIVPQNTVEEVQFTLMSILEGVDPEKDKIMIVLDSLGNLSTKKEVEDTISDSNKKDMTRAQEVKKLFRLLALRSSYKQVPVIIINHTYSTQSFISKVVVSGGKGAAYGATTTIILSKSKDKDKDGNVNGVFLKAKTDQKSRLARENMVANLYVSYAKGLDKYYGLTEIAEACGYLKKESKKYEYKGELYKVVPTEILDELLAGEFGEKLKSLFAYGSDLKIINDEEESNEYTEEI